ncbi:6-bladed beta-propeller [Aliifodinibius sp. S!AR15-10]|uniref:6-bladed beta-propeller n=1 Tax=Aliifodinibius sp. S!AR15-10 TaxID=2950437 RepID=UPI00285ECF51|nr:6-bladed beta-propeller [Aliifodinibius sp. S!AR15-10]MDR8393843.1 6-bladed beta-propeller [Aliifodinibius sp. S!AR15-10]
MAKKNIAILIIVILTACTRTQSNRDGAKRINFNNISIFQIEELFSISKFNDDTFFSQISNVVVGHDKTIFVSDPRVSKIFMFDHEGTYLGYLGGEGRGPGEFTHIGAISLVAKDTLHVLDNSQMRITFFAKENGEWKSVKYFDAPESSWQYGSDMVFKFNDLYPHSKGYLARFTSSFTPVDTASRAYAYYALHDYQMNSVNTQKYLMHTVSNTIVKRTDGRSVIVMQPPIGHKLFFDITSDGRMVSTWTKGNRITIQNVITNDSSSFYFPSQKVFITDKEKDMLIENYIPDRGPTLIKKDEIEKRIPKYKRISQGLHVDEKDRIWIKTRPRIKDDPEWLMYGFKGELLGAAQHPGGEVLLIHNNRIYVRKMSPLGEPKLHVYDLIE